MHSALAEELLAAEQAEAAAKAAYDKARDATARVKVRVLLASLADRGITTGTEVCGVSWRGIHHGTFAGCSISEAGDPCAHVLVRGKKSEHKLVLTHPIQLGDLRIHKEG